jgi:hypothetical protein
MRPQGGIIEGERFYISSCEFDSTVSLLLVVLQLVFLHPFYYLILSYYLTNEQSYCCSSLYSTAHQ